MDCHREDGVAPAAVGVHQGGGRLPLGGALLQDLVDLRLILDEGLFQSLDNDTALACGIFKQPQPKTKYFTYNSSIFNYSKVLLL